MRQYKIFEWDLSNQHKHVSLSETEEQLNILAKNGWRVVCQLQGWVKGFLLVKGE